MLFVSFLLATTAIGPTEMEGCYAASNDIQRHLRAASVSCHCSYKRAPNTIFSSWLLNLKSGLAGRGDGFVQVLDNIVILSIS